MDKLVGYTADLWHFRGSEQQQFVSKSIIIGRSRRNSEDSDYPDVPDEWVLL